MPQKRAMLHFHGIQYAYVCGGWFTFANVTNVGIYPREYLTIVVHCFLKVSKTNHESTKSVQSQL